MLSLVNEGSNSIDMSLGWVKFVGVKKDKVESLFGEYKGYIYSYPYMVHLRYVPLKRMIVLLTGFLNNSLMIDNWLI